MNINTLLSCMHCTDGDGQFGTEICGKIVWDSTLLPKTDTMFQLHVKLLLPKA